MTCWRRRWALPAGLAVVVAGAAVPAASAAPALHPASTRSAAALVLHLAPARAGRPTTVTASTHLARGVRIAAWTWVTGDGHRASGRGRIRPLRHTYRTAGRYHLTLSVTTAGSGRLRATAHEVVQAPAPAPAPAPTPAATPSAPAEPVLAGDTTVTAARDSVTDVRLPSDVTIDDDCGDNTDLSVTGPTTAPIVFVLHRTGSAPLIVFRPAGPSSDLTAVDCGASRTLTLPAGDYRAWLLTTAAASAHLTLPGLTGTTTITPTGTRPPAWPWPPPRPRRRRATSRGTAPTSTARVWSPR